MQSTRVNQGSTARVYQRQKSATQSRYGTFAGISCGDHDSPRHIKRNTRDSDSILDEKEDAFATYTDSRCSYVDIDGIAVPTAHDSYDRTYTITKHSSVAQRKTPKAKRSFKDRFWSHSAANYFGPESDEDDSTQGTMSGLERKPYVPTHAGTDFYVSTTTSRTRSFEKRGQNESKRPSRAQDRLVGSSSIPGETSDYAMFLAQAQRDALATGSHVANSRTKQPSPQPPQLRKRQSVTLLTRCVADYVKLPRESRLEIRQS